MIKSVPVLSFQDNDIDANSSSIDAWIADAHEELQRASSEVQSKTIGKFTMSSAEVDGSQIYLVYQKMTPVGVLILHRNDDRVWATETIGVLPEHQGQNLGTLLYESALTDLGKIGSSVSLSGGSSKVWKALCLKHKGVFVIPEEYSRTGKPLEVQIKGWSVEGGITYPVFSRANGSTVSLIGLLEEGSNAAKRGYYLIKAFGTSSKISEHWPFN